MIYELRSYTYVFGKLPRVLAQIEDVLPIWERIGIRQAGFWTVAIGDRNQVLHYLVAWESYAERDEKWAKFANDPEWIEQQTQSKTDANLYEFTSSSMLMPTSFSAVR